MRAQRCTEQRWRLVPAGERLGKHERVGGWLTEVQQHSSLEPLLVVLPQRLDDDIRQGDLADALPSVFGPLILIPTARGSSKPTSSLGSGRARGPRRSIQARSLLAPMRPGVERHNHGARERIILSQLGEHRRDLSLENHLDLAVVAVLWRPAPCARRSGSAGDAGPHPTGASFKRPCVKPRWSVGPRGCPVRLRPVGTGDQCANARQRQLLAASAAAARPRGGETHRLSSCR